VESLSSDTDSLSSDDGSIVFKDVSKGKKKTSKNKRKKSYWDEGQDKLLKGAIAEFGEGEWLSIATRIPGKSNDDCCKRWVTFLKRGTVTPNYKMRDSLWTEAELQELRDAVATYGTKWKTIHAAGILTNRSEKRLCAKWAKLNPSKRKRKQSYWDEGQDKLLKDAVAEFGEGEWVSIATRIPGKSNDDCCKRWVTFLKRGTVTPNYKKRDSLWTEGELQELRDAVATYGTKWRAIHAAGILTNRSECTLCAKWISLNEEGDGDSSSAEEEDSTKKTILRRKGAVSKSSASKSSVTSRRSRKLTPAIEDEGVGDADDEEEAADDDDEDDIHTTAATVEEEVVADPRFIPGTRIKWEWVSEVEDV